MLIILISKRDGFSGTMSYNIVRNGGSAQLKKVDNVVYV